MARDEDITFTMKRTQALAVIRIFEIGLSVAQALQLIQNTTTAEQGINVMKQATSRRR